MDRRALLGGCLIRILSIVVSKKTIGTLIQSGQYLDALAAVGRGGVELNVYFDLKKCHETIIMENNGTRVTYSGTGLSRS